MTTAVLAPPPRAEEAAPRPEMSLEDFLAMPPEKGVDRSLIRGRLWERPVTVRNRRHFLSESRINQRLQNQLDANDQPAVAGSGEAGVVLTAESTAVGVDVVVVPKDVLDRQDDADTVYFRGVPLMAVEILSPSNTIEEVDEKVEAYLDAGVSLVWVVHPRHRQVTAYRPGLPTEFFAGDEPINADPAVPGLDIPTRKLFER